MKPNNNENKTENTVVSDKEENTVADENKEENKVYSKGKHHAEIVIKDYGTIALELDADVAPITVENFAELVNKGFYNGLTFHRIVKDFMIQGGDPKGDGTGGSTFADLYNNSDENQTYKYSNGKEAKGTDSYTIKGEFVANGYNNNTLNLEEGVLAMARNDYTSYSPTLSKESYNSSNSQFFIMTTNNHTNLSGYYTGFGKVIEGIDVVKAIENVECKAKEVKSEDGSETQSQENQEVSTPTQTVKISSVTVETNGVNYGMPETLEPFNYMKWLYSLYGMEYKE